VTRPANNPLPHLVESFFRDHLQNARGVSPHTVRAYRDTLRLLLLHLADTKGCTVADLQPDDLQVEAIANFLDHLESQRGNAPHVLRHSCAVALLQAGNDITVIRDYLGHASVATTSRYVTTNLKMKREALEAFWKRAGIAPARVTPWQPKPDLLAFLDSL
jgi:site-specific recombinase XerD